MGPRTRRSLFLSAIVVSLALPAIVTASGVGSVALAATPPTLGAAAAPGGPWAALGSNGAGDGALSLLVRAVAVSGNDVYVAGHFTDAAGIPEADHIAKWDGRQWSALGSRGAGIGALDDAVEALVVSGTDLYVGGRFHDAGGVQSADYVAKWNGTAWSAVGVYNGALNDDVHALAVSGSDLYLGGSFTDAGGVASADRVARFSGGTWHAVGPVSAPAAIGNGDVYALAPSGSGLIVGGSFADVAGIPEADNIATWDGNAWAALGSNGSGDGAIAGYVWALAPAQGALYVGGTFYHAAVPNADMLAKWDGSAWSSVGSTAANPLPIDGSVFAIAVRPPAVYVAGEFRDGGGVSAADNLARWNGSTWSALGSDGAGDGALDVRVQALALSSGGLYAGGQFSDGAGNPRADSIAKWLLGGPRKPDGRIRLGTAGPFTGNDVYDATAAGQVRRGSAAPRGTVTFEISVQNDQAVAADSFRIRATGAGTTQYVVRYWRGTTDITSAIVAGTYQTPMLAPGAAHRITVKAKVDSSATAGSSVERLVTIRSADDPTRRDAVRLIAKRASTTAGPS